MTNNIGDISANNIRDIPIDTCQEMEKEFTTNLKNDSQWKTLKKASIIKPSSKTSIAHKIEKDYQNFTSNLEALKENNSNKEIFLKKHTKNLKDQNHIQNIGEKIEWSEKVKQILKLFTKKGNELWEAEDCLQYHSVILSSLKSVIETVVKKKIDERDNRKLSGRKKKQINLLTTKYHLTQNEREGIETHSFLNQQDLISGSSNECFRQLNDSNISHRVIPNSFLIEKNQNPYFTKSTYNLVLNDRSLFNIKPININLERGSEPQIKKRKNVLKMNSKKKI